MSRRGVAEDAGTEEGVDVDDDALGGQTGAEERGDEDGQHLDGGGSPACRLVEDLGPDEDPEKHELAVKVDNEKH